MRLLLFVVCAAGLTMTPAFAEEKPERGRSAEMPAGLEKREAPPPGIGKRVEKKGRLPPGLGKRFEPMVRRGVGPGGPGGPAGRGKARGRR